VSLHREIEATQFVPGQRVGTTLQYDDGWSEDFEAFAHDRLEDALECLVRDAVSEGNIQSISVSIPTSFILLGAGSREVLSVFVEAARHNPIGSVEGLFDTISVMTINVDVEYAGVRSKEFQDGENDIIDIAESRGFPFLCVMESAGPVDRYIVRS
jgi:hypothetical protein